MQPEITLTVQIVLLGLANPCPELPNWIFPHNYPGRAAPPFKEGKRAERCASHSKHSQALNSSSNLGAKSSEASKYLPAASLLDGNCGE